MKNVIVTSKIYKDKNGVLCFSYDKDILNFLKKLNLLIRPFNTSEKIDHQNLKNCDGLFIMGGGNIHKIENNKLNTISDNFEKKVSMELIYLKLKDMFEKFTT